MSIFLLIFSVGAFEAAHSFRLLKIHQIYILCIIEIRVLAFSQWHSTHLNNPTFINTTKSLN